MSLLSTLSVSANALQSIQQALAVTQQNLVNASSPGYAKQRASFETLPFDATASLPGGVAFTMAGDTRSDYAENAVWRQTGAHASAREYVRALSTLEPLLSTGSDGLAGAMQNFFSSARGWSADPNNAGLRESFVVQADALAQSFHAVGDHLQWMLRQVDQSIAAVVSDINRFAGELRDAGAGSEEGAVAYATLERLSEIVGITARREAGGAFTIAITGQTTLLTGSSLSPLAMTEDARIVSASGDDLTDGLTGGRLKGLLDARSEIVALIGNGETEGALNRLASSMAAAVNETMTSGFVQPGPPPAPGIPLFAWDEEAAAMTLKLAPGVSASTLAAYDAGPPPSPGGNAFKLAQLVASPEIDGDTFAGFFDATVTRTAARINAARDSADSLAAAVETAVRFRSEITGVSIEEEAVTLMSVQRSYEAAAKVLTIVDELLATTINLVD